MNETEFRDWGWIRDLESESSDAGPTSQKPTKEANQRIECQAFKIKKRRGPGKLAVASSEMESNQWILAIRTMGKIDRVRAVGVIVVGGESLWCGQLMESQLGACKQTD